MKPEIIKPGINHNPSIIRRVTVLVALGFVLTVASKRLRAEVETSGTCGGTSVNLPFSDVQSSSVFFCSIAEAYFAGLTNGTSATTYSPNDPVPREQMAAFVTRTLDQSLKRGSQRAALGQWWTQQYIGASALTQVSGSPRGVQFDGQDVWVACESGFVARVHASDGKAIDIWGGMSQPRALLVANGRIYVAGGGSPGKLYAIDPDQPAGNAVFLADVCTAPSFLAYDGEHIVIAGQNSITTYHAPSGINITYNSSAVMLGALYDGKAFWVTDQSGDTLKKFRVDGAFLQTVNTGNEPWSPIFDGTNIWIPNRAGNSITVVRAETGAVIATLTGNGLNGPRAAAFDGQRVLVTNYDGDSVSLWRATDLAPLGSFPTGANTTPYGVCSDGRNFWIALRTSNQLARF